MLHLYQSNKLEYLADLMAKIQQIQPLNNPMAAEEIVVQSQGMRRFISQYLAKNQGIAANLHFSLPAGLSWQLTRQLLPNTPALNPFAANVVQWRLFTLFQSAEFAHDSRFQAAHTALQAYLHNEYAAYQLSAQLADVFDQYLVYRPHWLEAWTAGKRVAELDKKSATEQDWQMILWQYLDDGSQQTAHRAQLWHELLNRLAQPQPQLPQRFFVFGIATLAPMYLTLLKQLAIHREVHIFALNPSAEYWGNVIEPAQILQAADDVDLSQQGHPLLASLGKQGRDFFNELAEANPQMEAPVFDENPVSGSLLHSIQHHIQTLTHYQNPNDAAQFSAEFMAQHRQYLQDHVFVQQPEKQEKFHKIIKNIDENTALHRIAQFQVDNSIQIHSAHSPLRELQILKEQLLHILHHNPTWQPHDIAVLTPHIEPYAPFIEAVFGDYGNGETLPFSISDVKLSRRQPFLYAIEQLLALLNSRFETDKLLLLLDNVSILNKFELSREDLPLLHQTVAQLNIRWGADQAQRAQHGDNQSLFTWQQGLERLILGFMLPENATMWQGIAAHNSRPDHLGTLSKFSQLVQKLAHIRQIWQQPTNVAQWCERMRQLHGELLHIDSSDQAAEQQLEQALATWLAETELANFQAAISADTAIAHMTRFLSMQSEAGFLRGGITFCSMVPMRSLPFKVVCLIGLNDGDFPRTTKASSFDLIAKHTQKGDRARRDDDRYLFLEAILSAREILYLSFVGKDIRTDEMRAPSALLNELGNSVAELAGVATTLLMENWVIQHPLQAFSRQYFSGSLNVLSSRQDYANALNAPAQPVAPFIHLQRELSKNLIIPTVSQESFIEFWRNPSRYFLRQQLDWQKPFHQTEWRSDEPFMTDAPRHLADAYLTARQTGRNFSNLANELHAKSLLPMGELGELLQRDYAVKAANIDGQFLRSKRLPKKKGTLQTQAGHFNYRLNHQYDVGQMIYASQFFNKNNHHGRFFDSDKIELLLLHLIYCAADNDATATHFISLDNTITLPAIDYQLAQSALTEWLAAYQLGQIVPLPFFPRINLAAAEALYIKKETWHKAINKAASKYHSSYDADGLNQYPEIQLIYNGDELPYEMPIFRSLTENLFQPLGECLQNLNNSD